MRKVLDSKCKRPCGAFLFFVRKMKKLKKLLLYSAILLLLIDSLFVRAESDGSLQLNSDMITNQSIGGTTSSDFAIRSQLFSKRMMEKVQEKEQREAENIKIIQNVDFNQENQNKLFQANYQRIKTELFKNYDQTNIGTSKLQTKMNNRGMLILMILALPLMILTTFIAKRFTRRKRKNEKSY
ncbi:type VII secretion protein EssA [Enterococcus faecalis]|uniref:type VII secretion protein EssA n=1 Tax=Enterococcus faecalis TaxID=1351 RepID=UPI0025B17595|nr:type VII secretion protein EssA [Enterococcus faecalis]MDN3201196.1 type VII secretion protein EssA [Enterococcus faecalis]